MAIDTTNFDVMHTLVKHRVHQVLWRLHSEVTSKAQQMIVPEHRWLLEAVADAIKDTIEVEDAQEFGVSIGTLPESDAEGSNSE